MSDETKKHLDECQEAVEKLEEVKKELEAENEHLREAADTFGDLAERLNTALKERRGSVDPAPDPILPPDRNITARKRPRP